MMKNILKTVTIISLITSSLYAEKVALYKGYINSSYNSAKNSIMGGATTATAKGYAALNSNPAGLSTNYNATAYIKTIAGTTNDAEGTEIASIEAGDHFSVGFIYDSFAVEYKNANYLLAGGAYGYDSKYGLFSIGASYTMDQTDLTADDSLAKDEYATGDYLTWGMMWQKTFLDEDDFYAVYFGLSHKNSGKYEGDLRSKVIPVSPSRTSYGIGLETNMFNGSILFTYDISEESWESSSEKLSSTAYGIKWMMGHKFAIGGGISSQSFSASTLKDIETMGVGIEWGFLGMHLMPSYTTRTVNSVSGVYIDEQAIHLDLAFTF